MLRFPNPLTGRLGTCLQKSYQVGHLPKSFIYRGFFALRTDGVWPPCHNLAGGGRRNGSKSLARIAVSCRKRIRHRCGEYATGFEKLTFGDFEGEKESTEPEAGRRESGSGEML